MPETLTFTRMPSDREPAATLLAEFIETVFAIYGELEEGQVWPTADPKELGPPHGSFLVGEIDGEPACCGGFKAIPGPDAPLGVIAEIKRMYVRPEFRGRGIARKLLQALEEEAKQVGHTTIRLDTGNKQQAAIKLYRSSDYREIPDYNQNAFASFWFEKDI